MVESGFAITSTSELRCVVSSQRSLAVPQSTGVA